MTTVREDIHVAIKAALDGITGIAGLAVDRNKDEEVVSFPAAILLDGEHRRDDVFSGTTNFTLTVTVVMYVRGNAGDLGSQLNALYGAVVKAVLADLTFGGKAVRSAEVGLSEPIQFGEGGKTAMTAGVEFSIEYWTIEGDPETVGP